MTAASGTSGTRMVGRGAARGLGLLACGAMLLGGSKPGPRVPSPAGATGFATLALDVCSRAVGGGPRELKARSGRQFKPRFFSAAAQAEPHSLRTAQWALYLGPVEGLYVIRPAKAGPKGVYGYASEGADRCAATAEGITGAAELLDGKLAAPRSRWTRTSLRSTRFGGEAKLWTHTAANGEVDKLMQTGVKSGLTFAIVTGPENLSRPSSSESMRSLVRRLAVSCTRARPAKAEFGWGKIADTQDGFSVTTSYPDPPGTVGVHRDNPIVCAFVTTADDPGIEATVIQTTLAKLAVAKKGQNSYHLRSAPGERKKSVTASFKRVGDILTVTFEPG